MSDELAFMGIYSPTIKNLYGHRGYIDPEYGSWESWYAWYPVKRVTWGYFSGRSGYVKVHRWEWRTHLLRRKVISKREPLASRTKVYWEYTTMEEALRWE